MKIDLKMGDLKIIDGPLKLQKKIKESISEKFKETEFRKKLAKVGDDVAKFFYIKFLQSDTFYALVEGDLRGEFGFSDSYLQDIESVCDSIASSYISVEYSLSTKFIKITIGLADNEDIDLNEVGVYTTENGQKIHWLYWLLTQGTNVVVQDYNVKFIQGAGRSHMAIMVQDDYVSYSVDEKFAGTNGNNWITRTINENKEEFLNIIKKNLNGT